MGLFDYVKCKVPLPDGYTGTLQTKDFDDPYMGNCALDVGFLTASAVVGGQPVCWAAL